METQVGNAFVTAAAARATILQQLDQLRDSCADLGPAAPTHMAVALACAALAEQPGAVSYFAHPDGWRELVRQAEGLATALRSPDSVNALTAFAALNVGIRECASGRRCGAIPQEKAQQRWYVIRECLPAAEEAARLAALDEAERDMRKAEAEARIKARAERYLQVVVRNCCFQVDIENAQVAERTAARIIGLFDLRLASEREAFEREAAAIETRSRAFADLLREQEKEGRRFFR